MKASQIHSIVLALLCALMLISCGDSSDGLLAGGGIGGTGNISSGPITAFGSIVVNGTEFDTSNAAIIVDGELIGFGDDVAQNNLDVGRVVTVYGSGSEDESSAVANRVTYNDNVEGPVESIADIDAATKEIVVLGQTVIVNVITKFWGTSFDNIAPNDVVAVSGLLDDTGAVWATFIEKTDGLIFEVTGFVQNLDTNLETFEINDLTVDYSLADTSGLPGGVIANGFFVEVEGSLDVNSGEMLATEIELADELGVEDAGEIEVTGFVTDVISDFEFTVGNQVVHTNMYTLYIDGTLDDISLGQKLEAEGSMENGILYAWEVEFWEPDQIEVEGLVTNDALAPVEFTVGDQVVRTDEETVFKDLEPEDIALGIYIEVKGVPVDIDCSILVADKVSFEED